MGWGLFVGLGQGLSAAGQTFGELAKVQMAEKLQADREAARDARQEAKERRQITRRVLSDGKIIGYNNRDEVVSTIDATPEEIAKAQQEADTAAANASLVKAQAKTAEQNLTWETQDRELLTPEQRGIAAKIKAGIELSAAEKERARQWEMDYKQRDRFHNDGVNLRRQGLESRLSGTGDEDKPVDVVQDLRKQLGGQLSAMQAQYNLSTADMNNAIQGAYNDALKTSRRTGRAPSTWLNGTQFIDILDRYLKERYQ